MGLMMSILIGCVGVLELLACLRHVADGVVITINQPATPCLSYHEQANDNRSTTHDSICSFSHSSDANLPPDAKRKLENLHEYSLRIRTELRSLDASFDYNSLSVCGGREFAALPSRRTPDSRFSPDFDYLCERATEGTCHEADNWRVESSSRDRPLSVIAAEPERYVRVPTPIPRDEDEEDEDDDDDDDDDEASSSGASSDVGTSFDNDSGNEAPTMRSFESIPIVEQARCKTRSELVSSVDESDYNEEQGRGTVSRTVLERRIWDAAEVEGESPGNRAVASQRKRIKSSSTIVRKPSRLRSKNAEVSKSAENLTARAKASRRCREPERWKSDTSVRATTRDEWTNTSPPRDSPATFSSRSQSGRSVSVQTSFEKEEKEEEELMAGGAGSFEASKELDRDRGGGSFFKNRRFGSRDEAGLDDFSMTNAIPSVEGSKDDEARLLKISSFEEADEEDYERIKNILSDSESEKRWRGKGYKSLSSFEDEEYWDAEDLIFSGEYTKAMSKDWHSGHFCCWQCDESLTGQRYVLRDEHPYCIKCYESVFANGCEECNKIIGIDSKDLSYKDKHWHEACFLCNRCRVSLVDKQFGSKVDKIYCGNCYDAQFASRCDGCGEIFRAGTKKMEYKTRQWHEKCFCCVVCKNPIGTKSFIPREQEIYCAACYEDKFATRCVKCNKIITSGGVTYKNEPWHRDCFTCSNCNNSLAGQRFTSRDDKPYCADCFGELFAKRCTACSKPITGIGGTRFISFEDRHWHNDCFICAGCKTSLVGRGFITDGEDIICPDCAKMKLM
ncbi:uncharacterized protein LOC107999499 isoform X3 [Apis cerana]|uniref:uncharacterized protein LOC107999499 isoform X3 n=1 Tax=Apis cerana TaxID=7461 RepID=UPI002B2258B2|nr:uncharacterized protein LOC107999499 isoform X3 [Apis cerana]